MYRQNRHRIQSVLPQTPINALLLTVLVSVYSPAIASDLSDGLIHVIVDAFDWMYSGDSAGPTGVENSSLCV